MSSEGRPAGGGGGAALALRLAAPAAFLVAALVLPSFMLDRAHAPRGAGLGPAAWPQAVLALIAAGAAIWLLQELIAWRRGRAALTAPAAAEPAGETYSYRKAAAGLAMIVAYGALLPVVGFPLATAVFIALWCFLGGLRRLVVVVPVALLGTVVLLWVFMGVALMPLSRGQGVFDQFSIAVLQLVGIY